MPQISLDTPVQYLRGVGPVRSKHLAAERIHTILDLLSVPPVRYECLPKRQMIHEWTEGATGCIAGRITRVRLGQGPKSPSVRIQITDTSGICHIAWFNSPYLRSQIMKGMYITATGTLQQTDVGPQMVNPQFQLYEHEDQVVLRTHDSWCPVYASMGHCASRDIARLIESCETLWDTIPDYLPTETRRRRELLARNRAFRMLHQPTRLEEAEGARRRLAYDELLLAQLAFAQARQLRQSSGKAPSFSVTPHIDHRIRRRLPFELTAAQNRAVDEICSDLSQSRPMFRLLQGDVGSGKTAVAVYASLVAIAHRHQVALLAPTEILAQQHYDKITQYLEGSQVNIAFASGSISTRARKELLTSLADGSIHWVVGTHALLESDVRFHKLGLAIIDEQHRFGVRQRESLQAKGRSPHYLVLSATPIPRTQALALVGDLDMSILDELPSGRGRIFTHLLKPRDASRGWRLLRDQLDRGFQAYIVFPLIEESKKLPLKALLAEAERLRSSELEGYRCGVLHGQLDHETKSKTIESFRAGKLQALLSTTVIEVGVDVPRATVMAVHHPERFGLAQLHQLRGRVGRGCDDAHFLMFAESLPPNVYQRLSTLVRTRDGFAIAAADLKIRGPGLVLGTRQHGMPQYRFARLESDARLLHAAREDATSIFENRIQLTPAQKNALRQIQKSEDAPKPTLAGVA